jgi:hypothetical protein
MPWCQWTYCLPLKELLASKHNTHVELETQTNRNEYSTICVRKIFYILLVIGCKITLKQLDCMKLTFWWTINIDFSNMKSKYVCGIVSKLKAKKNFDVWIAMDTSQKNSSHITTKCLSSDKVGFNCSNEHLVTRCYSGSSVTSLNCMSLLWPSVAMGVGETSHLCLLLLWLAGSSDERLCDITWACCYSGPQQQHAFSDITQAHCY